MSFFYVFFFSGDTLNSLKESTSFLQKFHCTEKLKKQQFLYKQFNGKNFLLPPVIRFQL